MVGRNEVKDGGRERRDLQNFCMFISRIELVLALKINAWHSPT